MIGSLDAFQRVESIGWPPFREEELTMQEKLGPSSLAPARPANNDNRNSTHSVKSADVVITGARCSFHAATGLSKSHGGRAFVDCAFNPGGSAPSGVNDDRFQFMPSISQQSDPANEIMLQQQQHLARERLMFGLEIAIVRLSDTMGMWLRIDNSVTFVLNHSAIRELRWRKSPAIVAEFLLHGLLFRIHHSDSNVLQEGISKLVSTLAGPSLFVDHCRLLGEQARQSRRRVKLPPEGQPRETDSSEHSSNDVSSKCSDSCSDVSTNASSNSQLSDDPADLTSAVKSAVSEASSSLAQAHMQLVKEVQAICELESPLADIEKYRDAGSIRSLLVWTEGSMPGDCGMSASHPFAQSCTMLGHRLKVRSFGNKTLRLTRAQAATRQNLENHSGTAKSVLQQVDAAITALVAKLMKPNISQRPKPHQCGVLAIELGKLIESKRKLQTVILESRILLASHKCLA